MIVLVKIANFLAKYSCPKWNGANATNRLSILIHKVLRRLCRYALWGLVLASNKIWGKAAMEELGNTYPFLFRLIANWEEDDGALVVDPANFVIKYATSYCAWKIYELTGKWPTNPVEIVDAEEYAKRERKHDAKYWLEFLQAQDCYIEAAETVRPMHHYIGIDPDYGEYGLVVWFETTRYNFKCDCVDGALVSTYENKQYLRKEVLLADFTWVEVGKKPVSK